MATAKRETIIINDCICAFDNAREINQFGRYDLTCYASPDQLKVLDETIKKIVITNKFPESIPMTYVDPQTGSLVKVPGVTLPGYNKPYGIIKPEIIEATPELVGLMQLKAGSKFAPKTFIRDVEGSAPRPLGIEDAGHIARGKLMSIMGVLNVYDAVKEGKRFCGISILLQQVLYSNVECGFELAGGGEGAACSWQ
jgi:hypothetical protein